MRWQKLGCIYKPSGELPWARSHATCPTPLTLPDRLRLYIQCRDDSNVGRIGFVDVALDDPTRIIAVHDKPVLDIGRPGTFDENGVFQTCVLRRDPDELFMYYVGFELGTKIRYRLLTGLAVSRDNGITFKRVKQTPILERSDAELYVRGGPWVVRDGATYRMWYVAGSEWTTVGEKSVPVYDVKEVTSADGIHWPDRGETCVRISNPDEIGFGRPYVVRRDGGYRMYYSVRLRSLGGNYTVGFADSADSHQWTRRDREIGLATDVNAWDSDTLDYAAEVSIDGKIYLFYNGNEFGKTGFGVARLIEE